MLGPIVTTNPTRLSLRSHQAVINMSHLKHESTLRRNIRHQDNDTKVLLRMLPRDLNTFSVSKRARTHREQP